MSVGGLEAVHLRHLHVQQDDGELVGQEPLERLPPGLGLDEVLPQALEHRLERDEVGGLVVHQQDVDHVGRAVGRSGGRSIDRGAPRGDRRAIGIAPSRLAACLGSPTA